jgi:hypothetical protein
MIQIEMEMPKCCFDCKFLTSVDNKTDWFCYITRICLGEQDDWGKRQSWCPLQEVEE